MSNKYLLSKEENIALIQKVFENQINMQDFSALNSNLFLIKDYIPPFSIAIEFSEFDCKAEILVKPNPLVLKDLSELFKEFDKSNLFKGCTKALCNAMHEYKTQKFGSEYQEDYKNYCELMKYSAGNQAAVESLINIKNEIDKEYTQFSEPENG